VAAEGLYRSFDIQNFFWEFSMDNKKFLRARKTLGKTQKQLAELLGISLKAIHSYEQGWRKVPGHVERQILFLVSRKRGSSTEPKPCWTIKNCPPECKHHCPAWEFQTGDLCWFINGTICGGVAQKNWHEKIKICRSCEVLTSLLEPEGE
jgi:DNA-binding XRE family transcriptional regulator